MDTADRRSPAPPGALTSASNPIRVNWIAADKVASAAGWTGSLGMTFLPGKRDHGSAGNHWRDLEADMGRLRDVHQNDRLVLLVEDQELALAGVVGIANAAAAHGVELVRFPIVDGKAPSVNDPAFRALLDAQLAGLRDGSRIVVACRGGLGRTGTVVACLLREAGLDAAAAIDLTRRTRHRTIESLEQERFVAAWTPHPPSPSDTPFARYEGGGRRLLGVPKQGDGTARKGYGRPVFEQCGFACVYCGLDMRASFESWLQLSVDHVIPHQMIRLGWRAEWVEDITNLVTCCRACNDFGNRFVASDAAPASEEAFFDIRDRVFAERRVAILAKRAQERAVFESLPAAGPDLPPPTGEAE